jgi:hypothetical protein
MAVLYCGLCSKGTMGVAIGQLHFVAAQQHLRNMQGLILLGRVAIACCSGHAVASAISSVMGLCIDAQHGIVLLLLIPGSHWQSW